jgi:protein-L-isoaspartate(D-aspartate) O-methyltransferase
MMTIILILAISAALAPDFKALRQNMVETQIAARGVEDTLVLNAMLEVERHRFMPKTYEPLAYADRPLPIGHDQTISQPYIVALMTSLLELESGDTVLEIGTGSGYQAAILAEIGARVYTIEILEPLAETARKQLDELGYTNIEVKCGDGYKGWPEYAPFDGIIVTCAPPEIPVPLLEQLKVGGKLVIPVGESYQELLLMRRTEDGFERTSVIPVRFVPMTGEAQKR